MTEVTMMTATTSITVAEAVAAFCRQYFRKALPKQPRRKAP
jgi:hypothetical protein